MFVGDKEGDLRVIYRLTASMGADAGVVGKDQIKYLPLVNKRLLIISAPPQKINFNLKIVQDFQSKSMLFIKHGESKITGEVEKDAYQPNETINLTLTFDNTKGE